MIGTNEKTRPAVSCGGHAKLLETSRDWMSPSIVGIMSSSPKLKLVALSMMVVAKYAAAIVTCSALFDFAAGRHHEPVKVDVTLGPR